MPAPFPVSPTRGIRHALKSFIPNWLSSRPNLMNAFTVLYVIALYLDAMVEVMLEGTRAPLPGIGDASADPYIGQGRGIIQGIFESNAAYELRLQMWLDTWTNAGSDETLLGELQAYLGGISSGPNLTIRLVTRAGHFTTINPDGSFTFAVDSSWDWDQVYNPERVGWWSDLWIVVYLETARWRTYTSFTDPEWLAAWGTSATVGYGIGFEITRQVVDDVAAIVANFKGAHTWLEAIIWTTDATLFIPGSLGVSGNPNGYWGNWSFYNGTSQVPARTTAGGFGTVRYSIPGTGG